MKKLSCLPGPETAKGHFFAPRLSPSGLMGVQIDGDFQQTKGTVFSVEGNTPGRSLPGAHDLHNYSIGPDDQGSFAWDHRVSVRVATKDGTYDVKTNDLPLGFDPSGNVIVFHRPPLVRPHLPMTMMPPAKGVLSDALCALVRRIDPQTGSPVAR